MRRPDIVKKCLRENLVKNSNILNFMENYPINRIEVEGQSIMIRGKSDENWVYISSTSEDELIKLLEKFKNEEYFAVIENWMLPHVLKNKDRVWQLSCLKLYYPEEAQVPMSEHDICKLKPSDAQYIYEHSKYKAYTSIDYIKDRIARGIALGIYDKGKLTAWILTHDDGAIGFLNVLESYRNKGYGLSLTAAIIKEIRDLNKIPFVHIEEDNIPSMNMAKKIGFINDRKIHWLRRKNVNQ